MTSRLTTVRRVFTSVRKRKTPPGCTATVLMAMSLSASYITVRLAGIDTMSPAPGSRLPAQIAGLDQLPSAVAVIVGMAPKLGMRSKGVTMKDELAEPTFADEVDVVEPPSLSRAVSVTV